MLSGGTSKDLCTKPLDSVSLEGTTTRNTVPAGRVETLHLVSRQALCSEVRNSSDDHLKRPTRASAAPSNADRHILISEVLDQLCLRNLPSSWLASSLW